MPILRSTSSVEYDFALLWEGEAQCPYSLDHVFTEVAEDERSRICFPGRFAVIVCREDENHKTTLYIKTHKQVR